MLKQESVIFKILKLLTTLTIKSATKLKIYLFERYLLCNNFQYFSKLLTKPRRLPFYVSRMNTFKYSITISAKTTFYLEKVIHMIF